MSLSAKSKEYDNVVVPQQNRYTVKLSVLRVTDILRHAAHITDHGCICITAQPTLHSTEVLLQSPHALLPRCPTEVTDAPEQLSENRRLLLSQSWFEILQHLLRRGLAIHAGLKSYKVAQIHQQLIVPSGWSWGGACSRSSRDVYLLLLLFSLAGGQAEVITDSHLGQ